MTPDKPPFEKSQRYRIAQDMFRVQCVSFYGVCSRCGISDSVTFSTLAEMSEDHIKRLEVMKREYEEEAKSWQR